MLFRSTEGQYGWISGETSPYTNWFPGEPNNSGDEDYVLMNFGQPGKWNDSQDDYHLGIVEIDSSALASLPDPWIREGNNVPGRFVFSLDQPSTIPVDVAFALSGTASGSDYQIGSAKIPAGTTSYEVNISTIDDLVYEGDETLTLKLKPGTYLVDSKRQEATIQIRDNEPIVSLEPTNNAYESGQNGRFTVRLSEPAPAKIGRAHV